MNFESIEEIYAYNDRVRENLIAMVGDLSEEDEKLPTENGKWDVAKMVEHLAVVEGGMMSISTKLLTTAKDNGQKFTNAGLSENFIKGFTKVLEEDPKLEAPQRVQPEGGKPIAESLEMMKLNREQLNTLRPMFEEFDGTELTFPHPYFGPLTAIDWLALIGGHEERHTAQIAKILRKENAAEA